MPLRCTTPASTWSTSTTRSGPAGSPRSSTASSCSPSDWARNRSASSTSCSASGSTPATATTPTAWSTPSSGRAEGASLQPIDLGQRPEADERAAHDRVLVDRAEAPAVGRVGAVVAHHEHVVLRDLELGDAPADRLGGRALRQVRLLEPLAVDEDVVVAQGDGLAGQADDPLDQVLDRPAVLGRGGLPRRLLEHDDVAALDVVELVAEAVDDDPVVAVRLADERGLHRRGGDPERREQERADDQRDQQRTAEDQDLLDDVAEGGGLLLGGRGFGRWGRLDNLGHGDRR